MMIRLEMREKYKENDIALEKAQGAIDPRFALQKNNKT